MTPQEIFDSLGQAFGEKLQHKTEFRGETTYAIAASDLREIAKFCCAQLSFDYLLDITSIDNFGEEPRFEIVYHLYSMPHGANLRLKLKLSEEIGALATVSDIWPTANWHEREIYDMMGIKFNGHPDLRRILMWDGYPFFPLRKDFPLAGLPSDMPDVAFTKVTPLEGGPFVTVPSTAGSKDREPRARRGNCRVSLPDASFSQSHQAAETGGAVSGLRVATITSGRKVSSRGPVCFCPDFG